MADPMDRVQELSEARTARRLMVQFLKAVGSLKDKRDAEAADSMLQRLVLKEMCDYKDRLFGHVKAELLKAHKLSEVPHG